MFLFSWRSYNRLISYFTTARVFYTICECKIYILFWGNMNWTVERYFTWFGIYFFIFLSHTPKSTQHFVAAECTISLVRKSRHSCDKFYSFVERFSRLAVLARIIFLRVSSWIANNFVPWFSYGLFSGLCVGIVILLRWR